MRLRNLSRKSSCNWTELDVSAFLLKIINYVKIKMFKDKKLFLPSENTQIKKILKITVIFQNNGKLSN